MRVLICYDGSPSARGAIETVAKMSPGCTVVVMTAWQALATYTSSWGMVTGQFGELNAEAEAFATRTAEEGAGLARAAGLEAEGYSIRAESSLGWALVDRCIEGEFDLVAIGSVGSSAVIEALVGGVASTVLHHAKIPVLLSRTA